MSITSTYLQCKAFIRDSTNLLRAQRLDEPIPTSLRNDIGRFEVWAQNAGAHQKSTSLMSLDHRLREARVKIMVIKLFDSLKTALQDGKSSNRRTTLQPAKADVD
jgi:hypothetical protein